MSALKFKDPKSQMIDSPWADQSIDYICWSRMQAEAGQTLDAIVARKDRERLAGEGLFTWGVGNAPSTIIKPLARLKKPVRVIFSAMKTKPKAVDVAPSRTVVWRRFVDENGIEQPLPINSLITSRGDSAAGVKNRHYALMCFSDTPLALKQGVPFDPSAFRNAGGIGAPVGASQVTALLQQVSQPANKSAYEANISARLTLGYWVRLSDPLELNKTLLQELGEFQGDTDQWLQLVNRLRGRKMSRLETVKQKNLLL